MQRQRRNHFSISVKPAVSCAARMLADQAGYHVLPDLHFAIRSIRQRSFAIFSEASIRACVKCTTTLSCYLATWGPEILSAVFTNFRALDSQSSGSHWHRNTVCVPGSLRSCFFCQKNVSAHCCAWGSSYRG